MRRTIFISLTAVLFIFILYTITNYFYNHKKKDKHDLHPGVTVSKKQWKAPDTSEIAHSQQGDVIRYGRALILHTSGFFGPKGSIAHISNGMNCGNCHIDGGTRLWGNNFSGVASTYPLYRNRSGKIETLEMRINDCFERSLNGKKLTGSGEEMKAMVAYINWVGKDVRKGTIVEHAGTESLPFLNRPADTTKGRIIYSSKCMSCHGKNGEGRLLIDGKEYLYPPLWGVHSYNTGAGIYALSKFAGYIKNNMPFGTTFKDPQLTNEDAWDVAAFVNSRPRPLKHFRSDWPDISAKPFDYPFGPYSDSFSVTQHKYGPYKAIEVFHKNHLKAR